jgi:hypothetical protein
MSRCTRAVALILPFALLSACDSTDPAGKPIALSFSSQSPTAATTNVTVTIGANTLIITKAQLVVRRVKLKPTETAAATCTDDDTSTDDCPTVQTGPILVDLPLADNAVTTVNATVPAGTYSKVDFRIHKATDDAADATFRAANPNFNGTSIRVEGTFNGSPFVFTSDLTEKQELTFATPLVVDDAGSAVPNLTIQVDVNSWFKSGGALVNPATANKGGANENVVKQNIRNSLRAFRDDDRNGR